MEEYVDAKKNIFRYQDKSGKLILNFDNDITRSFASEAKSKAVFFSRSADLQEGSLLRDGMLVCRENGADMEFVHMDEIIVPGLHNVENFLAAIAAVKDYVSPESVRRVAATFNGVEHRNELVRELNGVRYYNSAIDSSPNRTIATLKTFKKKVILIAGGKDKNIPYDDIGSELLDRVKLLILTGPTGPKIEEALLTEIRRRGEDADIPVIYCQTYSEAVRAASKKAEPGDVVLLSPASTSFDMFRNFEERGNLFKELVNQLE
jgi:UDP-N-acetylmuramoylalanine--D-glutamate ligase